MPVNINTLKDYMLKKIQTSLAKKNANQGNIKRNHGQHKHDGHANGNLSNNHSYMNQQNRKIKTHESNSSLQSSITTTSKLFQSFGK